MQPKGRRLGAWLAGSVAALSLCASACVHPYPHLKLPPMALGEPSFFPTLEAYAQAPIVGGNRIDVLLNGDELFPSILEAVRGAERTISYAQYTYEEGLVARALTEALAERCRAGVTVNVLLDGVGTLDMPLAYRTLLSEAGCHVVTFRPLGPAVRRANNRNHRRLLIVDGRVGFTGGSGVGAAWMGNGRTEDHWRTTDVRIEGPAVTYLQGAFAENWLEATGEVLGGEAFFPRRPLAPTRPVYAQVVRSSPAAGSFAMYTTFLLAIAAAQRSIDITNPYFVPDDAMRDALVQAARRGVRVTVLIPGAIDHDIVKPAGRRDVGALLRAGVGMYEYQPALLHAKTMVIDGRWSTIGSANFDNRSFALNDELNVVIYDTRIAGRLERVFADDLAHAKPLGYRDWRHRGATERLFELFVAPFHDLL